MNEDFIYYIAIAIVAVGSIAFLMLRRKRKAIKPTNIITEPLLKQTRYHRCSNTKCNTLIPESELWHEFNHTTEPASEYVICPKCKGRMFSVTKGEPKIPLTTAPLLGKTQQITTEAPVTEGVKKYDLTIDSRVTKNMLKIFSDKGITPTVSVGEDGELHIQFESDKTFKFDTLTSKGWIKNVKIE